MFVFAAVFSVTAHADVADPCSARLFLPPEAHAIPVMSGDHADEHGRAVCAWLVQGSQALQLGTLERGTPSGIDRVVVRRADGQPLQVLTEATTTPVSLPPTFLIELATPAPQSDQGLFAMLSLVQGQ